eukprot:COSAG02_NODE_4913_length_4840_cov_2.322717_3_plen_69_part_00
MSDISRPAILYVVEGRFLLWGLTQLLSLPSEWHLLYVAVQVLGGRVPLWSLEFLSEQILWRGLRIRRR